MKPRGKGAPPYQSPERAERRKENKKQKIKNKKRGLEQTEFASALPDEN